MGVDGVILLHGIFRTHRNMAKLARFLEQNGYSVLNLGYPSTKLALEGIAEHIHPTVSRFASEVEGRAHFVGFSMGGLVIRAYLHRHRPGNLGRVVMLGTPNNGSEVADALRHWWLYRKIYGPAGQQLVTGLKNPDALFGKVDYELGVIAGNRSIDPVSSRIINKPSDGKVSIESTRLAGMKDHILVDAFHTFFPNTRSAWQQTLHFLKEGRFAA
jgi:pimeloyl-ACP methyl ester carboxylesterase